LDRGQNKVRSSSSVQKSGKKEEGVEKSVCLGSSKLDKLFFMTFSGIQQAKKWSHLNEKKRSPFFFLHFWASERFFSVILFFFRRMTQHIRTDKNKLDF
jgi:hypothetical protein